MAKRRSGTIPPKTLHRLILYRNVLSRMKALGKTQTSSGELALLCGNGSAQVRRDLMEIDPGGRARRGYEVARLLASLQVRLLAGPTARVAMVGVGRLGAALAENLARHKADFKLRWVFDRDPGKIGQLYGACPCTPMSALEASLRKEGVELGVIAIDGEHAQEVCDILVKNGARAIVNLSAQPVRVPRGVHLEQINMSLVFQKLAFHLRRGS